MLASPYAGDVDANVLYARKCVRDALERGDAPMAPHLLYTQDGVLDDADPEELAAGLAAGVSWIGVTMHLVVYCDRGISRGMLGEIRAATERGASIEFRWIE